MFFRSTYLKSHFFRNRTNIDFQFLSRKNLFELFFRIQEYSLTHLDDINHERKKIQNTCHFQFSNNYNFSGDGDELGTWNLGFLEVQWRFWGKLNKADLLFFFPLPFFCHISCSNWSATESTSNTTSWTKSYKLKSLGVNAVDSVCGTKILHDISMRHIFVLMYKNVVTSH